MSSHWMTASDQQSGWVSGWLIETKAALRRFGSVPVTTSEPPSLRPSCAPAELPVRDAAAELIRRQRTLQRTRTAIGRMRAQTTVAELLADAPAAIRTACGLARAAVLTRRGSELVPLAGDIPRPGLGNANAAATAIVVAPDSPEAELLRRGAPVLTRTADVAPERRLLAHPRGYAAAAVAVEGRTVAVLVAAGGPRHCPDAVDRDGLHEFAERLGWTLERLLLRQRTARQTAELGAALGAAQRLLDGFGAPPRRGVLTATPTATATAVAIPRDARTAPPIDRGTAATAAWDLTARERAVIEQMAGGKTNRRIAAELFLSEGTVKCHVKRILRKLGAANRAEAVARFLGAADRVGDDLDLCLDIPPAQPAPLRLLSDGRPVGERR
jgi:LuxR family transcriptional regulator, regulator of acetate metabolism